MFQLFEYFIFLFMDSRLGDAKRVSNFALCHFLKEKQISNHRQVKNTLAGMDVRYL